MILHAEEPNDPVVGDAYIGKMTRTVNVFDGNAW